MPRFIQPASLTDTAMNVLIKFVATGCHHWSAQGSLEKLRDSVAIIKKDISPLVPHHLSARFHKELLSEFECLRHPRDPHRPRSHDRAILEIVMDRKIRGLTLDTPLLFSLDLRDAHRIRGLEILNLTSFHNPLLDSLRRFHLEDLIKFVFLDECTDVDLQVIGDNCPKLLSLDVSGSREVTDVGLRALSLCSNLRIVGVSRCSVSLDGINALLSVNTRIRQLSGWNDSRIVGFDCFNHSDASVYSAINNFELECDFISNELLRSLVYKFPSLTTISIFGQLLGDINELLSLHKLSRLNLASVSGSTWDDIEPFLRAAGANIIELSLPVDSGDAIVTQSGLDSIFENCGNLESLSFAYREDFQVDKLTVPPFPNLKTLDCYHRRDCHHVTSIEFGKMSKLEDVLMNGFHVSTDQLESMIFNHVGFPNLEFIAISGFRNRNDSQLLRQIVRSNNIHLQFAG